MDYYVDGDDQDGENNEYAELAENAEEPEFTQKDAILFVVDARKAMCEPGANGSPSPLSQALGCVQASMKRRIQANDNDLMGLMLFGTKDKKAPPGQQEFPYVYVQQELEQPTARAMRSLQDLRTDDGLGCGHMDDDETLRFEDVLWMISHVFNGESRAKNCRKRVYLMTNDADPSQGNPGSRKRAMTRVDDLEQAHVWLEPFFFPPAPPATFDLSAGSFWSELVGSVRAKYRPEAAPEGETDAPTEDTSDAWKASCLCGTEGELLDRVTRKQHRKRVLGKVSLVVGGSTTISLNLIRLIAEFKKPTAKKIWSKNAEVEIKSETVHVCNVHGSRLSKQDMWRGFDFGGQWVYFAPNEIADATNLFDQQTVRLLGFHDRDRLKPYHNTDTAYFAEAAERRREGSQAALEALVGAMLRKDKVGFATLTLRGKPRLVAMVPQAQEADAAGVVQLPCGLHLVPLPFSDDLRKLPLPPPLAPDELSQAQQDAASSLVAALTLPPDANPAGRAPNPARHKHFAYIQALSTKADPEPTVDSTLPDDAWLAGRSDEIGHFKEAFDIPDAELQQVPGASAPKRQKVEKGSVPETVADWLQCWQENKLDKQTMTVLKDFCKSKSLPVSGKKDDLVKRVHAKLEEIAAEEANAVKAEGM